MSEAVFQASDEIRLEGRGDHALLVIDREAKRNAMNASARAGMLAAMEHARGKYRAIVLTGRGTSFCAGVDLKEDVTLVDSGTRTRSQEWAAVNVAVREHPAIFIAAVNGTALGGGLTLINVCDLAVAADNAELGMPEITFAAYPSLAGVSTQLSLARKRAAWMVLTGERVGARTAMEWGLINECVPAAQLLERAEAIARRIAGFDPYALAACKKALDTVPAVVTDWDQAFAFGDSMNAVIRSRTTVPADPLAQSRARR
ncbi:hypothetical protein ASD04_10805 [Devosia sp. Root436]|uniref:enoyl-CoA hydratase/isomerase family protein n=1 Tax=Devosia sp. Root436 TaxID=1736537 RepID=UPI0006F40BA3|nr:enoyl-CoA hydratase/isomerase family protein [Devosia sp. Root436]KQX38110.1 hypothetical protein ASD04_10805 [Devosia sp. Root436]